MIFLLELPIYSLADQNQGFHFIHGVLYPTKGTFTEITVIAPTWSIYIGV